MSAATSGCTSGPGKLVSGGGPASGPTVGASVPASADPVVLAQLASATIHTIAIRARARVPRKELEAIVKGALDVLLRA